MPIQDGVVVPYFLPLGATDLAKHLNVTGSQDAHLIGAKLAAATDWVGAYTGLTIDMTASEDEEDDRPLVPPRVREAILMLAAHLYNNRESVLVGVTAQELPFGLLDMLSDYRAWCA
jgi:hypothetical protein